MKISVLLVAFILILQANALLSQPTSFWQPSGLQGSNIQSLQFINGQTGRLLASTANAVYFSSDNGASWHLSSGLPDGTGAKAFSSRASSFNDAFAATNRGVFRSTDFGESWSPANGSEVTINSISFIDQNNAWAVGSDNSAVRTTDAGQTWSVFSFSNKSSNNYRKVVFVKKTNATNSTVAMAVSGSDNSIYYAYYNSNAQLSGSDYTLQYKAQNGLFVDADTSERYNSIFLLDGIKGWVVGNNGKIYKNYDISITTRRYFYTCNANTTANFYGVFFTDSSNGWVVGSGGSIYMTTNSGSAWSAQTSNTSNDLKALYFTSSGQGWIAGVNGTILFTSNYGANWSAQTTGTTEDINAIKYISPGTLIAVGNNGTIIKTTNSGSIWFNISSPASTYNLTDITSSGSDLLITGQNQLLLKSTDSGVTWSSLSSLASINFDACNSLENTDVLDISIPGDTIFIYACTSSRLVRSTDNGFHWRTMTGYNGTYFCLVSASLPYSTLSTFIGTSNGIRKINSTETISKELNSTNVQGKSISRISFNPFNNIIMACTSTNNLYTTNITTINWAPKYTTGLPSPLPSINKIIPSPYGGSGFIISTSQGVFKDSVNSWLNKTSVCISGKNISSLAGSNSILFAGTSSADAAQPDDGIYKNVSSITASLSEPSNDAVRIPLSTALKWHAVACAISYDLVYSTTPDFSSGNISLQSQTDTFAIVPGLEYSTNYYWKVRPVFENSLQGTFSQAYKFTTRSNTRILTARAFPGSGGSITKNPDLAEYPAGSEAELTAMPMQGYIFTGWSGDLGSSATGDNPITLKMDTDRNVTGSFMPVSDVALWLCASSLNLPDGSPVAEWVNTASPGLNAFMPQPGRQPVFISKIVNSLPAVRFSADQAYVGRSDLLSIDYSAGSLLNQLSSKSVFIVFRPHNNLASRQVLFESGSNTSGFNIYLANDNLVFGLFNRYERKFWHNLSPLGSQWHLALLIYDSEAKTFRAVLDGSESEPVRLKSGLADSPDPSGIGGFSGSTRFHDYNIKSDYGRTFDGLIAEVMVFNSCDASVINDAFSALSSRYSLGFSYTYIPGSVPRIPLKSPWLIDQQDEPCDLNSDCAWPNPFSDKSYIYIRLEQQSWLDARLYDATGNEVSTLFRGYMQPGDNSITIDAANLSAGIYFYRVLAGDDILSGKVIVVK